MKHSGGTLEKPDKFKALIMKNGTDGQDGGVLASGGRKLTQSGLPEVDKNLSNNKKNLQKLRYSIEKPKEMKTED